MLGHERQNDASPRKPQNSFLLYCRDYVLQGLRIAGTMLLTPIVVDLLFGRSTIKCRQQSKVSTLHISHYDINMKTSAKLNSSLI